MEMLLFFKEVYDEKEKEECKIYSEKLFSDSPMGVGREDLLAVEYLSLCDLIEDYDDGYTDPQHLFDCVAVFHRTGSLNSIPEFNRDFIRHAYGKFITNCRLRMQNAIGLPSLLDCITLKEIDVSTVLNSSVDDSYGKIKNFNEYLAQEEIYDDNEKLTEDSEKVIISYVQEGVNKREIMFAQTVLYYDLQTTFVFDDAEFMLDQRRYQWRQMLGKKEDEVLEFPNNSESPALYSLKYIDFDVLVDLKYLCKYAYKAYCHRRRLEGIQFYCHRQMNSIVRFSGVRFWCSRHDRFFCYHDVDKSQIQVSVDTACTHDDLEIFESMISGLSKNYKSLLEKIVVNKSFFEVLSSVVVFFLRMGLNSGLVNAFVVKFEKFIKYGLILNKIKASPIVINRISDLFRRDEKVYLDRMGICDLREEGYTISHRVRNPDIVEEVLGNRLVMIDMEDMFRRVKFVQDEGQWILGSSDDVQTVVSGIQIEDLASGKRTVEQVPLSVKVFRNKKKRNRRRVKGRNKAKDKN